MIQKMPLRPWWLRYGFAFITIVAATLLVGIAYAFWSFPPFLLYVLAVAASSAFGRLGPGLFAAVLALLVSDFLFIATPGTLTFNIASGALGVYYSMAAFLGKRGAE